MDPSIETHGTSKSNTSRVLIHATTEKLAQFVARKLDDVDLVAMFIDGIEFAGHSVGIAIDGTKTPLGIWAGSTENTTVVTELLSNLVGRGLRVEQSMLFVIDGGKAIRRALRGAVGGRAVDAMRSDYGRGPKMRWTSTMLPLSSVTNTSIGPPKA